MHKATAKLQMKMGFAEGTWAGLRGRRGERPGEIARRLRESTQKSWRTEGELRKGGSWLKATAR